MICSAFIKVFANISLRLANIENAQTFQNNNQVDPTSIGGKIEERGSEKAPKENNWEERSKYKAGQIVRWKKKNVNVIVKDRTSKGYICVYAETGQEVEEPIWEMHLTNL